MTVHSWADRRFYGDRAFPRVLCAPSAGKSRHRTNGSLNINAYLSILGQVPGKGSLARLVYGPSILLLKISSRRVESS